MNHGNTDEPKHYTRPAQLIAISALWFGMNFMWAPILSLWQQERIVHFVGGDQKGTYLFYLAASGALVSTLIQLVIGPISDRARFRWGRRRPFIAAGVLGAVPCLLLFAGAPSFGVLLVSMLLLQFFINIATGPYQAVMPDLVPESHHGRASAFMGLATILGQGVALVLAAMLVGGLFLQRGPFQFLLAWPLQNRFWLLAAIIVIVLIGTMLWTVFGTREAVPADKPAPIKLTDIIDIRLRDNPDFAWLIASRFFINLGFYTATLFFEFYLRDAIGLGNKAPGQAGIVFLIVTFSGLVGNWPAGHYSDRISKKQVLYATCALLSVTVVWFLFVKSLALVYLAAAIFGATWGAFMAVDWALAANLVPQKEAGRYMAIWHLAFTVPQVIAPIVGPLADKVNRIYGHGLGWRFAFSFILLYLIIGVLALRFIRERPVQQLDVDSN